MEKSLVAEVVEFMRVTSCDSIQEAVKGSPDVLMADDVILLLTARRLVGRGEIKWDYAEIGRLIRNPSD